MNSQVSFHNISNKKENMARDENENDNKDGKAKNEGPSYRPLGRPMARKSTAAFDGCAYYRSKMMSARSAGGCCQANQVKKESSRGSRTDDNQEGGPK